MAAWVLGPTELYNPGQNTVELMDHAFAVGAVTRNRTDPIHDP